MAHTLATGGAHATALPCATAAVVLLYLLLLVVDLLALCHALFAATAANLHGHDRLRGYPALSYGSRNVQRYLLGTYPPRPQTDLTALLAKNHAKPYLRRRRIADCGQVNAGVDIEEVGRLQEKRCVLTRHHWEILYQPMQRVSVRAETPLSEVLKRNERMNRKQISWGRMTGT